MKWIDYIYTHTHTHTHTTISSLLNLEKWYKGINFANIILEVILSMLMIKSWDFGDKLGFNTSQVADLGPVGAQFSAPSSDEQYLGHHDSKGCYEELSRKHKKGLVPK